ncbi:hypothetical protein N657DRAFT_162592 [Parathielavia appendiculata]|uniref:Uncharacterized protein n=1 Tax=Parathielavia appendiculata TaxID=2587402 RepID=A0AAN6TTZ6_9PEZI|nr:hypothetical protein N657DRAFT_162592 [Parathielavia appendiculata]
MVREQKGGHTKRKRDRCRSLPLEDFLSAKKSALHRLCRTALAFGVGLCFWAAPSDLSIWEKGNGCRSCPTQVERQGTFERQRPLGRKSMQSEMRHPPLWCIRDDCGTQLFYLRVII